MDFNGLTELLTQVGFPIVACVGVGWYLSRETKAYREETREILKMHREEMNDITKAITNNNELLDRLIYRLDKGKIKDDE